MYANAYTYVPWLLFFFNSDLAAWQDTLLSNLTLHRAGPGDKGHRHHRCHCFHLHRHQATTHAVFLGSFLLLASTPSEFISSIMSFPWPCTVGMRINYIWPSPWWSSINIFNNCRSGERQQQGFWVIGILLTIADWWRETHRPGGTSSNPTRLWSASMSTILIPAPVLDLWGVLEFKVFSTNNFKGSVKQGNLSLGWRLSIGKPLLTNPN